MKQKGIIILLFLFCASNFAFGYSEKKPLMSKAEGYVKVKMYNDAINELSKIIAEDPTYAKAHLLLGDCFLATNQPAAAGTSYERYLILKPGNGKEIAPKLVRIGDVLLANNQVSEANKNYSQAINYYPSLKPQVAENIFQKGKSVLYRWEIDSAENLFVLAGSYNPQIISKINQAKVEFGMRLLAEAKAKPKSERERYLIVAKRYVSQDAIAKAFPPPKIVTVFKKEYTGQGMGEKDYIPGVPLIGKDILKGDKVIIRGAHFKFLDSAWAEYQNVVESINGFQPNTPDTIGVRAPVGEKITIEVQRSIEG